MTAPALIGPALPTPEEYEAIRGWRDAWARSIARDVARGFVPGDLEIAAFRSTDGAVQTVTKVLRALRACR